MKVVLTLLCFLCRFLQQYALEDEHAKELLVELPCIAVENCSRFVQPRYTVLNLYQTEQIKPFLYKVPPCLFAIAW